MSSRGVSLWKQALLGICERGGELMITELMVEVTDRRVLGVEAAAVYLDTSPRTIQRLISRGVLTPVNIPTLKRVLIAREDLDKLIDLGKVTEKVKVENYVEA
jgi:excisionase family DNA binding protein